MLPAAAVNGLPRGRDRWTPRGVGVGAENWPSGCSSFDLRVGDLRGGSQPGRRKPSRSAQAKPQTRRAGRVAVPAT